MKYTPTIGLEIHIQLKTISKMFCGCSNRGEFEAPNTTVCPVCLGHPGTLPVINAEAVKWTAKTALALNCEILEHSKFDRKNYFYPDIPKGYQISQYDEPLSQNGYLIVDDHKIHITRIHLEEDTGKLTHPEGENYSLVDFNRAGTPLMELVTEPDIQSASEAKKFCQELQLILRYLNVSNADMEKGQMRCEVNISLMDANEKQTDANGVKKLGTKVEIKNLNSFRAVERSIEYEIKRQAKALDKGEKIVQETRGWDEHKQITVSQRLKEEAHDYRYFPEPDLPPLKFTKKEIEKIKTEIPELPRAKKERFQEEYSFNAADARVITLNKDLADYTEQVISELRAWLLALEGVEGSAEEIWEKNKKKLIKLTSGWIISRLVKLLNENNLDIRDSKITPENFAELIALVYENKVNSSNAQVVLKEMFLSGADPTHIMEEGDLSQVTDEKKIEEIVARVIKNNPEQVKSYRGGKTPIIMFLVGQVMKESKGKANPEMVRELLEKSLN